MRPTSQEARPDARDLRSGAGHRFVRSRRGIQAVAVLAWIMLPLSGLLRVDLPRLRVLFAGHAWPPLTLDMLPGDALARGAAPRWDLIGPALAGTVLPVLALVITFVLLSRRFGRLHCGFTCVYGAMAEHGDALFRWARAPGPGRVPRLAAAWGLVVAAAPGVAFVIGSLFVGPDGLARGLVAGDPALGVPFSVLTAIALLMGGFVRLRFCRYVCGVGLVQTVAWVTNPKALEVGFNPIPTPPPDGALAAPALAPPIDLARGTLRDCTGCHGCRDVCPMGFDPRAPKRTMLACIQCGLCIERCEEELFPLGKGAAIGFHLAEPDYPLVAQRARK